MTDQPVSEGIVHGVVEELELPPEPPPSGPWIWVKANLLGGDTPTARVFNGVLTVVFALIALNVIQFVPSYIFSPDRRWSAVTTNMKFLTVQAFPQADLFRIWLSIGGFLTLVAWSLVAWGVGGRISLHKLMGGLRAVGVFFIVVAIMHGTSGADRLLNIGVLKIDTPGAWSSGRLVIFLIGLALAVGSHLYLKRYGAAAKDVSIPFLSVPIAVYAVVLVVVWIVKLPVAEGQFDETVAPIATTTKIPWTILLFVAIAAYWFAKWLVGVFEVSRFRRLLIFLWLFSYPVDIMVIQRKPILDWGEILDVSASSPLFYFVIFSVLGGALIWWLALPDNLTGGMVAAVLLAAGLAVAIWQLDEVSWLVKVLAGAVALGLIAGGVLIKDGLEVARIIGFLLAPIALLVWFVPMPFLLRTLVIALALVAVAAPSFGGTAQGRVRMVGMWVATVFLVVASFVLGHAQTALQFQGTTFIGGFNLTLLLAITGVAMSFPLGVVLALARTSTMPIFRLLATGYIELVRSVPLITWLFFGSVMLTLFLPSGVEFDEIVRIVAAITIFSAAYVAENIRGGLQSIGKGQYEAARAMGLTTVQSTSLIILPQAIRAVLPALVGSIIVSFKDTSLVAIVGLADVLLIAKSLIPGQTNPHNFLGTQPQMLFFIAIFYWMFTFTFSRLALRYEKSLGLGER